MFRASNTVRVTLRALPRAAEIIDAAFAAGANAVNSVSFAVDQPSRYDAKLRVMAVADARKRAAALARLSGVELAEVVSISEVVGEGGPIPMAFSTREAAGTMLAPGQLTLRGHIEVIYAIEDP